MTMRPIRKASEADRKSLIDLYLSDVEDNREQAVQFAEELINKMNTILYCDGEGICGTVSWNVRGGLDDGVIELIGLGVKPSHRRKGIARTLVETLLEEAKNFYDNSGYRLRVIYLFMEKRNEEGRLFYETLGFEEIADIPSFYPHDDACIWVQYL